MPIKVDPNKCDGCGICVYDCGANVFRFTNKKDKDFPFGNKYQTYASEPASSSFASGPDQKIIGTSQQPITNDQ